MDIKYHLSHPFDSICKLFKWLLYKPVFNEYHLTDNVTSIKMMTPKYITLGKKCFIGRNARIEGVARYNNISYTPRIIINDGVSIQQNLHLTCANKIEIGVNTAIAANVTITDIDHPYEDIMIPIERQDLKVAEVVIGPDCKIYNGVVILPGVHIGKHCVVGANSVVTKDIPDFCIVVGSPARIVKRYDMNLHVWRRTDRDGYFV